MLLFYCFLKQKRIIATFLLGGLKRRLDGISNQVDQKLLTLIPICQDRSLLVSVRILFQLPTSLLRLDERGASTFC
jgi:hypothetical protein